MPGAPHSLAYRIEAAHTEDGICHTGGGEEASSLSSAALRLFFGFRFAQPSALSRIPFIYLEFEGFCSLTPLFHRLEGFKNASI